ncbi:MAG TPA: hypothetical protein VMT86_19965 [Bryobacteraceae bacterium]|nr:hypothetical protein [Bryobacteraceae bacterium]
MADTPKTITYYADAIKWSVGLSGAAIGGIALHFADLERTPGWVHACVVAALFGFAVSIFSGVIYLPWLNLIARADERISEIETLLPTASGAKISVLEAEKLERQSQRKAAVDQLPLLKMIHNLAFAVALLTLCLGVVGVFFYKAEPEKQAQQTNRFLITQSAVHRTNHGMEAHTFLLDQVTGTIWQMVCQKGDQVVFREIQRMDANAVVQKR